MLEWQGESMESISIVIDIHFFFLRISGVAKQVSSVS